MEMVRTQHFLPKKLIEEMKARQRDIGITVSEQIRRAVKEYLREHRPGAPEPEGEVE